MTDRERSEKIHKAVYREREGWLREHRALIASLGALYLRTGKIVRLDVADGADSDGRLRSTALPGLERAIGAKLAVLTLDRNDHFTTALRRAAGNGAERIAPVARIARVEVAESAMLAARNRALEMLDRYVASDGLSLSPRLWNLDAGAREKIVAALRDGVARGEAIDRTLRDLLRGKAPDAETVRRIEKALGQTRAVRIGDDVAKLFARKGEKNIVFNFERVLITETNRVNRWAFTASSREAFGTVGMGWNLSPSHPRYDLCDEYANQNNYGLGRGVFPFDDVPEIPHPLCLCWLKPVFQWEVDRK